MGEEVWFIVLGAIATLSGALIGLMSRTWLAVMIVLGVLGSFLVLTLIWALMQTGEAAGWALLGVFIVGVAAGSIFVAGLMAGLIAKALLRRQFALRRWLAGLWILMPLLVGTIYAVGNAVSEHIYLNTPPTQACLDDGVELAIGDIELRPAPLLGIELIRCDRQLKTCRSVVRIHDKPEQRAFCDGYADRPNQQRQIDAGRINGIKMDLRHQFPSKTPEAQIKIAVVSFPSDLNLMAALPRDMPAASAAGFFCDRYRNGRPRRCSFVQKLEHAGTAAAWAAIDTKLSEEQAQDLMPDLLQKYLEILRVGPQDRDG